MAVKTAGISDRFYPEGFNSVETISADTTGIKSAKGFMVDLDGTLQCQFQGDSAEVDLPVLKGVVYPGSLQAVDITNSTTVTKVFLLRFTGTVG